MSQEYRVEEVIASIETETVDPILVPLLVDLVDCVGLVLRSSSPDQKEEHLDQVLNVCRHSRAVRLHVGALNKMSRHAVDVMTVALEQSMNARIPDHHYEGEAKDDYQHAFTNIQKRLNLLVAESADDLQPAGTVGAIEPNDHPKASK